MKNKKNKKKTKIGLNKILILTISVLIILGITIVLFLKDKEDKEDYYTLSPRNDKIKETTVVDANAYAWLRVQGTDIDTPIVFLTDSLSKDVKANYLWTSSYYKDGENRKAIYGHNIRNVSSYPDIVNEEHIKFEQLVSFAYYEFAKENLYIQYSNGKDEALYKIYAVTFNNIDNEYGQSYKKEELNDYINDVKYNSIYDYDVDVNENDELISLITCTRYFGAYEKTQFKVDARRVRKNEKISKYSVETNSNYDIIK